MSTVNLSTLGDSIFNDIDNNPFLNALYNNILYNYAITKLNLQKKKELKTVDIIASLRFADLLSKSTNTKNKDKHKTWAQEIIILLNEIYPNNEDIKLYSDSVFTNTGNYQAKKIIKSEYNYSATLENIFNEYQNEYLKIPSEPDLQFFTAQKIIYDHLSDDYFSYSGPTSMGKSFLMRMFIKQSIQNGSSLNYAIIVPTKALINEISKKIIEEDLKDLLSEQNYKVITSSNSIALEREHNFILVLTPERLLYLLISSPKIQIDYLFIDEAHKLSGMNSRAPFYYKTVDMLLNREHKPHFIFAAPNIPNPEIYLRLLSNIEKDKLESKLYSSFSPVAQIKFIIDLGDECLHVYNERSKELVYIASIKQHENFLPIFISGLHKIKSDQQTIVYFNGKNKAVQNALHFSKKLNDLNDEDLNTLSKDITKDLHNDYYLAQIIKKGVAYHIGYLPATIRMRIEELFKKGKIHTMFCTSTLLEGVNLPADNLIIADKKINRKIMSTIDFRNLVGRVGRISFNLYGNVFLISETQQDKKDYTELLEKEVPEQTLSISTNRQVLKKCEKEFIVDIFLDGSTEIPKRKEGQTEESYTMMRKFGLILLRDIMKGNESLVVKEFSDIIDEDKKNQIKEIFSNKPIPPDDDINISIDQTNNLYGSIALGSEYPKLENNSFSYNSVLEFLNELSRIFKWKIYESSTLGNYAKLRWYTVILIQWMQGNGISHIMKKAIEYHQNYPDKFYANHKKVVYDDSREHRNIVFANTLEVIDNIILFKIANYFLKFSNEYKKIHNVTSFDNDWHEYIEYGTTNHLTILLQRNGFSREVAAYIRRHRNDYIIEDSDGTMKLRNSLLDCELINVKSEAKTIKYNMPELFI